MLVVYTKTYPAVSKGEEFYRSCAALRFDYVLFQAKNCSVVYRQTSVVSECAYESRAVDEKSHPLHCNY
jgi:hypothetical protein